MLYEEFQSVSDRWHDTIPFIMEGQVVAVDDPDQMGRCRVWVPALDGEDFSIDSLPWTSYASPFMGFTVEYPAGGVPVANHSHAAYGFWAIPKIGATVLVFCLNGNPSSRYYFAATPRLHRNRSFPAGRNTDFNGKPGPFGDAGDGSGNLEPIQPAYANLRDQFSDKVQQSEAKTRGAYERMAAQPGDNKDGTEGYSSNPADPSYLDPQTYCLVTPGRHAIIMQDDPHWSRLRLKTAEGHQIIFDDANERIYVSTSHGRTWIELDQDGHVNIFGADSISMRSGADINLTADGNINLEAEKGVNIKANGGDIRMTTSASYQVQADSNVKIAACGVFDMGSESQIHITSNAGIDIHAKSALKASGDATVDIKAGAKLTSSGGVVDVKGGAVNIQGAVAINGSASEAQVASDASCPDQASGPSVVPGHEPWTRPTGQTTRGKNWKA